MRPAEFWDCDLEEVSRFLAVYQRRREHEKKQHAADIYNLANLTGWAVGRFLHDKNHFPSLEEAFPGLFEEEAEAKRLQQSINNFKRFAAFHNQKRKGVNDGGNP